MKAADRSAHSHFQQPSAALPSDEVSAAAERPPSFINRSRYHPRVPPVAPPRIVERGWYPSATRRVSSGDHRVWGRGASVIFDNRDSVLNFFADRNPYSRATSGLDFFSFPTFVDRNYCVQNSLRDNRGFMLYNAYRLKQPMGLIQQLSNFVDIFSRFAQLLDMASDIGTWTWGSSFPSLRWLLEGLGRLKKEFLFIFQTYTLFKFLLLISRRAGGLMGRMVVQDKKGSNIAADGLGVIGAGWSRGKGAKVLKEVVSTSDKVQHSGRRRGLWWILLLLSAIGGPLLLNRLWQLLSEKLFGSEGGKKKKDKRRTVDTEGVEALALFGFEGQSIRELSFVEGDVIWVTHRPRIPQELPAWWKGSLNGRSGFLPSNYVAVL